jgi:hypothetical protein
LVENFIVAKKGGVVIRRGLGNVYIHKPTPLVWPVLNEPQLPRREKYAVDMPHKIGVFGNFATVDADFPLIFENERLNRNFPIPILCLGGDFCVVRADLDELFIVANPQRCARTKVEHRFGAVGLSLTILPKEHVQTFVKDEFFPFVIPKIAQ